MTGKHSILCVGALVMVLLVAGIVSVSAMLPTENETAPAPGTASCASLSMEWGCRQSKYKDKLSSQSSIYTLILPYLHRNDTKIES